MTIVEATVVILIVALLSAILVPIVIKTGQDAKITTAKAECQMIADAVMRFVEDLNTLPVRRSSAYSSTIWALHSGDTLGDPASLYGFWNSTGCKTDSWLCTACAATVYSDLLSNHLIYNQPFGSAVSAYPTTGQYKWKGPYLNSSPYDPWGHPYILFLDFQPSLTSNIWRLVMSAGPNGCFDTTFTNNANASAMTVSGDDIVVFLNYGPLGGR